jgi:hypothetical protein
MSTDNHEISEHWRWCEHQDDIRAWHSYQWSMHEERPLVAAKLIIGMAMVTVVAMVAVACVLQ